MMGIDSLNPLIVFIYFAFEIVMTVFCMNPFIGLISLSGAVFLRLLYGKKSNKSTFLFVIITAVLCAIINPLFSHNGRTALLFVNNNPITLEAFLYGIGMGKTVAASILWCVSFSEIMTSDKVIYSVGSLSPKAALVLNMSLRFVPLFIRKAKEINDAQKAMGLYKDETITGKIKGISRVFSAMLSYIIENTIITANSMASRGYSGEKRSRYALFTFTSYDFTFLIICIALGAADVFMTATGRFDFEYYPLIKSSSFDFISASGYIAFALYSLIPVISEGGERIKWHFLKSKI